MFFLSMYTFRILTMRLCAQRNSCPKRTECSEDLIHTNTHPNSSAPSRDLLKFIYIGFNWTIVLFLLPTRIFVHNGNHSVMLEFDPGMLINVLRVVQLIKRETLRLPDTTSHVSRANCYILPGCKRLAFSYTVCRIVVFHCSLITLQIIETFISTKTS